MLTFDKFNTKYYIVTSDGHLVTRSRQHIRPRDKASVPEMPNFFSQYQAARSKPAQPATVQQPQGSSPPPLASSSPKPGSPRRSPRRHDLYRDRRLSPAASHRSPDWEHAAPKACPDSPRPGRTPRRSPRFRQEEGGGKRRRKDSAGHSPKVAFLHRRGESSASSDSESSSSSSTSSSSSSDSDREEARQAILKRWNKLMKDWKRKAKKDKRKKKKRKENKTK